MADSDRPKYDYECDLTKPPPEDDKTFLEHLMEERRKGDERRDFSTFDGSSVRRMSYEAIRWSMKPQVQVLLRDFARISAEKEKDGKTADIARDLPELWDLAKAEFPLFAQKSPTLLKMAIVEGNTDDFKRCLTAMITVIDAGKRGEMGAKQCTEAIEGAMYSKFVRTKDS